MRIETIFGAVAVLTLIVLAAFALTSGKGASVQAATPQVGQTVLVATAGTDTCACYEQAFDAARLDADFTRSAYEGGYGACRETAGRSGGDAWSMGWVAGMEGKASKRSCRALGR